MKNKLFNLLFSGADTKLTKAMRLYLILLFITVIYLMIETNIHKYQNNKFEIILYTIVFIIYPIGLLISYMIRSGSKIKNKIVSRRDKNSSE